MASHLLLLRHGTPVPEEENPERPLSEQGRREAEDVAKKVTSYMSSTEGPIFLGHSGKLRAQETAESVASALRAAGREVICEEVSGINPKDDPTAAMEPLGWKDGPAADADDDMKGLALKRSDASWQEDGELAASPTSTPRSAPTPERRASSVGGPKPRGAPLTLPRRLADSGPTQGRRWFWALEFASFRTKQTRPNGCISFASADHEQSDMDGRIGVVFEEPCRTVRSRTRSPNLKQCLHQVLLRPAEQLRGDRCLEACLSAGKAARVQETHRRFASGRPDAARRLAAAKAQIARDYYLESGDTALEAEAFRIEVLAKQDDGEYGAVNGEPTVKAPEIDLLCEIELARFQAAEHFKAEAVILYTLVEVNVTRPLHKMRGESQRWCEESQRIFNELGDTFWEGRAALMMVNVLHKFQQPKEMHRYAKQAYELFGVVGDRKRQGMSLHAKALACLNEKNTPGAVENALEALSIYRDIGISAGDRRLEIAELKTIAIWRMTLEGKQGKIAAREAVEAVELSRKYPEPNQETVTLHVALQALLNIGERKQVFLSQLEGDFSEKDMDLVEGIKSRKQKMHILIDLARSHVNHKKYNEAEPLETKNYQQEIEVWQQVVELHMATSHHEAALQAAAKRLEVAQRNKASVKDQVEALDVICTLYLVMKNVPEAERSAAEMLRMAKLNESLIEPRPVRWGWCGGQKPGVAEDGQRGTCLLCCPVNIRAPYHTMLETHQNLDLLRHSQELDQLLRPPPTDDDDEGEPLFARAAGTAVAPRSGARSAGLDRNLIKGKLLEHVRSVLTEEGTVDAETPLLDMGLDSLSAMDLQNLIASSFPFSPPSTTILFDYPTVRELTEYLVDQSQEAGL
eukprot:g1315.t2